MESTSVRLIRVDSSGRVSMLVKDDCRVEYKPGRRWAVEKRNAFDPSYTHRRGAYFEDKISVVFIMPAEDYPNLLNFVTSSGNLYIEFTWKRNQVRQLPCFCDSLPSMNDDGVEYTAEFPAEFTARYKSLTPIDWDGGAIEIPDGDEEIIT